LAAKVLSFRFASRSVDIRIYAAARVRVFFVQLERIYLVMLLQHTLEHPPMIANYVGQRHSPSPTPPIAWRWQLIGWSLPSLRRGDTVLPVGNSMVRCI